MRIKFAEAIYHVMARGDRREAIVRDDKDRRTFLRALGEACQREGFRLHAHVLLTNHYHFLIETPEGNLSRGMGWLQNAFAHRINTRLRHWGPAHMRYLRELVLPHPAMKTILEEPERSGDRLPLGSLKGGETINASWPSPTPEPAFPAASKPWPTSWEPGGCGPPWKPSWR